LAFCFGRCRESPLEPFVGRQTFEAVFLAQDVDVALREDGARPSGEFAASVEMVEQRHAGDGGFSAVERSVQRVRKFRGVGIARWAFGNGRRSGVKVLAIGSKKMLPGGLASSGARGG